MSRYFSESLKELTPYVPGEQPQERQYIKLNTNESPFPPSSKAIAYANEAAKQLQLYSDPECTQLTKKMAQLQGVKPEQVIFGNGSDEILLLAFRAFCDGDTPAVFPDITYGFYKVFAELLGIRAVKIPLKEDFSIDIADYRQTGGTIFIANPNAPTGKLLTLLDIEMILQSNPNNVVVIDEAYIDFGGKSAVALINRFDNLLVTQTFSKSRSLAGGRLGMAFGNEALIADLRTVKYSMNPYNVNSMTMAAGLGALEDQLYTLSNCETIMNNRSYITKELRKLGFTVLDSMTNFVMTGHPGISGEALYAALKQRGILVRYFDSDRLRPYVRMTIGTKDQMDAMLSAVKEILEVCQ